MTLLISKDLAGPKCEKALEWNIPVHTLEWLEQEHRQRKASAKARAAAANNE